MRRTDHKLNRYGNLQVLRAKTPEALTELIRQIDNELLVMQFGQDELGHFAYVRSDRIIKIVNRSLKVVKGASNG